MRDWAFILVFSGLLLAGCNDTVLKDTGERVTFDTVFEGVISPRCLVCHGANGPAARVPLETRDEVMRLVRPGDPGSSRLCQSLKYMPPGNALFDSHPELSQMLCQWIADGAI